MKKLAFTLKCVGILGLITLFAGPTWAGSLDKITAEAAIAGKPSKITFTMTEADAYNCGAEVAFGDGKTQDVKVVGGKEKATNTVEHIYDKPGTYTVKVRGTKVTSHFKCLGKDISTTLTVAAPPAPAAAPVTAAAPAVAAGPICPAGWTLDKKSVSKKTGAYTCRAKKGTALPKEKLACGGKLFYFEGATALGCRP
jgi:hypothetical protein